MSVVRVFLTFLVVLLLAAAAQAQTGNGVVKGAVSDASGSLVPGAKVRLENKATNVVSQTTTATDGPIQ